MILISHRGNLNGRIPDKENSPSYIESAIQKGFDVEIDVWYSNGNWFLGHDEPQYPININFLKNSKLWCHAKNIDALKHMLKNNIHCFWHQEDEHTLTSNGWIWAYPGSKLTEISIAVMPKNKITENCAGVCCDYIQEYKK
jgi:hypothetical protein